MSNADWPLRILAIGAAVLLGWQGTAGAQSPPLHFLVSNGVKGVLVALAPACETQIGVPFATEFGTSNALKAKAASGAAFDVAFMTDEVVTALVSGGVIAAASRRLVARTRIGVGVAAATPVPDVSTAAAMKTTLLRAPSLTYASEGASRASIERMLDRLGIAAQMAPKIHLEPGSTQAAARVVDGRTAILITLVSEIVPVAGMRLAGTIPPEFQGEVTFAAGTAARSSRAALALRAVECLMAPSTDPAYVSIGLERIAPK